MCHEEVAEEIFKLIKVILGQVYKKNISFQRPTFLHPEAALPDHPWVFIGYWVKINNFAFPLKAPRVPVPTFMWTMLIYQAGRWGSRESEIIWQEQILLIGDEDNASDTRHSWGVRRPGSSDPLLSVGCPVMERCRPLSILGISSSSTLISGSILPRYNYHKLLLWNLF